MRQFLRTSFGISLLATLLLAMMVAGEPIAHSYWNIAFKFVHRSTPSSQVLLTIDDRRAWSSEELAGLLKDLRPRMPRRVLIDTPLPVGENAAGDAALARAVRSYGSDIAFIARSDRVDNIGGDAITLPPKQITGNAEVLVSAWRGNFLLYAVSAPYTIAIDGREYSTVAAALSGVRSGIEGDYYPDFRIDPATIPRVPSGALAARSDEASSLTGRTVIVTALSKTPSILYFGHSYAPAIALDIAGAEGLKAPFAFSLGPRFGALPFLALVSLLIWLGSRATGWRKVAAYLAAIGAAFILPVMLRTLGLVFAPDAAFMFMSIYGIVRLWQKRARRIQLTSASGLPNLLALANKPLPVGSDVVVAVVGRYEEILATLPQDLHGECARQIARRIAAGSGAETIHHGDGGHFAWAEEARPLEMQLDHLEGLRALFAAPLLIGTHTFDTNIHFGLDRNEGLDTPTRVNSALASANEALANGRAIELFEASRLAEAPWELSLHARIEEGLRNGDIWLAFQPQWDLKDGRLRELGFRLSIDDFGTGEASLAYLADLPSDELKIDRRFIDRMNTSKRDHAIVANTISLAHALGQTVVAEGIEDAPTLAMLRAMGCDLAQGYLLGRPETYADLERTYEASLGRSANEA